MTSKKRKVLYFYNGNHTRFENAVMKQLSLQNQLGNGFEVFLMPTTCTIADFTETILPVQKLAWKGFVNPLYVVETVLDAEDAIRKKGYVLRMNELDVQVLVWEANEQAFYLVSYQNNDVQFQRLNSALTS